MNLLEEVDNYQHFDKSKIKNFIDFGNKIIENEDNLESKEFMVGHITGMMEMLRHMLEEGDEEE